MKNTATFRQLVYCLRPQIKWMKKRENREKIIIALEKEIAQKLGRDQRSGRYILEKFRKGPNGKGCSTVDDIQERHL